MKNRLYLLTLIFIAIVTNYKLYAQEETIYKTESNISYVSKEYIERHSIEQQEYIKERCKLDFYYPTDKKDFPTFVWFHGGGLEGGSKFIPNYLKEKGIGVIAVNYRLSPRATHPAYITDAAAAVAWAFENVEKYGGNKELIFIGGHSAGGYLTLMVGLDKSYLAEYNIDADKIAINFPISGQTTTHYTIRKERGLDPNIPIIDKYAPSNNARKETHPIVLYTGGKEIEMMARYEENAHLAAVLKGIGNKNVTLYQMEGFDHVEVAQPALLDVLKQILKYTKEYKENKK